MGGRPRRAARAGLTAHRGGAAEGRKVMLLGLDASIWKMLLVVLLAPVLAVGLLNLLLRRRGGVGAAWSGVLVLFLAGVSALLIILDKVRL